MIIKKFSCLNITEINTFRLINRNKNLLFKKQKRLPLSLKNFKQGYFRQFVLLFSRFLFCC